MIGFLSGLVISFSSREVIIDVNGVGYRIQTPSRLQFKIDQKTALFIHTHVRDDAITLFGFPTQKELTLFETLLTVSGIGPKSALNLISSAPPDAIVDAISQSHVDFFTAIPGIGKKSAQRLIVDLKSKLSQDNLDLQSFSQNSDLTLALTNLGFKANEIKSVLPKINSQESLEIQIKNALKLLR